MGYRFLVLFLAARTHADDRNECGIVLCYRNAVLGLECQTAGKGNVIPLQARCGPEGG